jgi:hypothetical protein
LPHSNPKQIVVIANRTDRARRALADRFGAAIR